MTAQKIFISYSKADRAYLDAARSHLRPLERQGAIALWDDTQLLPGEAWDAAIRRELAAADLILFLVSADLMATDYIWDIEMKEALRRAEAGQVAVVPVIIRPCVWDDAPFAQYTALPTKGKPIATWGNPDEAWAEVTGRIRSFVQGAKGRPSPPPPATAGAGTQINDSRNVVMGGITATTVHIGDVYHHGPDTAKAGETTAHKLTPTEKEGIERAIELKTKIINKLREALALEDDPIRSVRYEEQLRTAEGELAGLKARL